MVFLFQNIKDGYICTGYVLLEFLYDIVLLKINLKTDRLGITGGTNIMNKSWRTFQIIQFIFFLCFSIFLFTRRVDGHGTVQTLETKLISFAVWGIFYIGILAIEWLIYFIVRHSKK